MVKRSNEPAPSGSTNNDMPDLFVVDGSNIATEGRDKPSLEQLNESIAAFAEEYPAIKLTVVVDATFGHRIAKKEVAAFDKAVASNEIVTPPAGAIGRGDAFILAIANKAKAGVLSNDSFQEFHGEYGWLFDHGRLIGGKPVPHVGWVFVDRNPVRGRKSRESIAAARKATAADSVPADAVPADAALTAAKEQAQRKVRKKQAPAVVPVEAEATPPPGRPAEAEPMPVAAGPKGHVNDLVPFLDFVADHAVGAKVSGQVDSYSSHGAYVRVGDVLVYVPLRFMSDPPPTSARKVLTLGQTVEVEVVGFVPDRRSIDAAMPAMAKAGAPPADAADQPGAAKSEPARKSAARKSAAKKPAARKSAAKQSAAKKSAAKQAQPEKAAAKQQAAGRKAPAKQAAAKKQAPAKRDAATTAVSGETSQAPAKKAAARKRAAAAKKQPAAKQPAAKQAAAKQPAAKQPAARRRTAKKAAAKGA